MGALRRISPKVPHPMLKIFFLRKLQKDDPTSYPEKYICYTCLGFHDLADPEPRQPRYIRDGTYYKSIEHQIGFPFCRSNYIECLRDAYARLDIPRAEQKEPEIYWGQITSPVRMRYRLYCGIGADDIFLHRSFVLEAPKGRWEKYFMVPSSFLRTSNLEICPHVYFGYDHIKGEGSINDALGDYYHTQHEMYQVTQRLKEPWSPSPFGPFVCEACRLEVEIRFKQLEVTITVWQHIGCLSGNRRASNSRRSSLLLPKVSSGRSGFIEAMHRNGGLWPGDVRKEWDMLDSQTLKSAITKG